MSDVFGVMGRRNSLAKARSLSSNPLPNLNTTGVEALLIILLSTFAWHFTPFIGTVVGIGLCIWAFSHVARSKYSPMLTLRLAVLGLPGLSAAILQLIRPDAIVALYFTEFQTPEITQKVILVTSSGMAAALLAWVAAMRSTKMQRDLTFRRQPNFQALYLILYSATLLFFALDFAGRRDVIWQQAYGYGASGGTLFGINVYGSVAVTLMVALVAVVLAHPHSTSKSRWLTFLTIAVIFLLGYLPRGERSEIVAFATAFYVMYTVHSRRNIKATGLLVIFAGISLFALALAAIRTFLVAHVSPVEALFAGLDIFSLQLRSTDSFYAYAYGIYDLPVFGMSFLLYGVIGLTQTGALDFEYGQTILAHLINTLPEIINPFRTENISWLFNSTGYASAGGFMELGEGYLNGGLIGVIALSFIVSYFYFAVFRQAWKLNDTYSLVWLGVLSSFVVRATLYGVNDLYKGVLSFALVFFALRFAAYLLASVSRRHSTEISPRLGLGSWH